MSGSERVYATVDKSTWGEGEWQDEPDKVQWTDAETGLPCLAKRAARSGHWCGYVGVAEGHPAFEQGYDDVRAADGEWPEVHGGLTYAEFCDEGPEAESICHVPEPGQPERVWWLGFDCAHGGDESPGHLAADRKRYEETGDLIWSPRSSSWGGTYRTLGYVRAECANLARQLSQVPA